MKLKQLFAASALAAASLTASAANQDVFGLQEGIVKTFTGQGPLFSSLDGSDTISFYGLAAGQYEIVLSYSGTLTKITAASLNGQAPEEISTGLRSSSGFFDIVSGSPFVLKLWGNITGTPASSLYNGTITVTAVPEPETYGMLLGGLALVGLAARRKAKKAA